MSEGTLAQVLAGEADWCLVEGDCLEVLPTIPDRAVAHVITDPPYDARTHAGARAGAGAPEGIAFAALSGAPPVVEWLRVASRWVLAFCTFEQIRDYRDAAGPAWIRAGVWDRVNPSPQLTGDRPGQAADAVAIAHRAGRKSWNGGGHPAIWRHSAQQGLDKPDHPTPKPLPLMLELVSLFTDPGELILDAFAGSGTTGVACLRLGRRFIGIEKDPKYAAIARERLRAESNGLSLRDARAGQLPMFGAK